MGAEVKLFYLRPKVNISRVEVEKFLLAYGCVRVSAESDESQNFEINTKKGITELPVSWKPSQVINYFSIRFSYGNPSSVIDQTFDLILALNTKFGFEICSSDLLQKIGLDKKSLSTLRKQIVERKKYFEKSSVRIDRPIRGGKETFDYIRKIKSSLE
ncbi:hypothetical protein HYV84_07865 [Candidatus Woesearchaeota archaeon]|nr:hypothetical protein [Candidatus Woesearchaeota archaeon]